MPADRAAGLLPACEKNAGTLNNGQISFILAFLVVAGIGIGIGVVLGLFTPAPGPSVGSTVPPPEPDKRMPPPARRGRRTAASRQGRSDRVRFRRDAAPHGQAAGTASCSTTRANTHSSSPTADTSCSQCTLANWTRRMCSRESTQVYLEWDAKARGRALPSNRHDLHQRPQIVGPSPRPFRAG